MKLFIVLDALVLNVVVNHVEVTVLTNCVGVVATGPKVAAPEFLFDDGVRFGYMTAGDTFDFCDYIGESYVGYGLYEKVNMILVSTNLDEFNVIRRSKVET